MAYATWIADELRRLGVPTEEYAGWTTRGSSSFEPGGVVAHWTAGPCEATGRLSLNTCVNGRADLPGPLCNVYLDRQGVCVVVAAGRANHAGEGGWRGLTGNSSVLGVEAECCNAGDWTPAQRDTYPVVLGALAAGAGRDPSWICRHCDWTDRKIDTGDLELAWLQAGAAAAIAAAAGGAPASLIDWPEVADMYVGQDQMTGRIWLISGNTKLEFPAGGGGDPHSPGKGNLYADELIRHLHEAFPAAGWSTLVALNPDIVARIPTVFDLIDQPCEAQPAAPGEQADPAALEWE